MSSCCTLVIRTRQRIHKKWWVTNNRVKAPQIRKLPHVALHHMNPISKRRSLHILSGLSHSLRVNVYAPNHRLRKTLRHHQRYQARTTANIQNSQSLCAIRNLSPSTKQRAVSTHLHGTTILTHCKLFEFKVTVRHFAVKGTTKHTKNQIIC